jgi:hypothetical protein
MQFWAKYAAMSHSRISIASRLVLSSAVAFISFLLWTWPAIAASEQAQERAARKACLSGDYAKGVDILADLFVATKDLNYIFNQGRCFEQNRRYEDAIGRFREYLLAGSEKLDQRDKSAAEQHIAKCNEMLAQDRASSTTPTAPQALAPAPPPVVASTPEPAPTPEPSTLVVTQPATQPVPAPAPASAGAGLRVGGIIAASFGVASLGAGVLFNLKANSMISDMKTTVDGYSPSKNSEHDTYKTLAWVGYGVGAACVVTGAILYGVGLKAKSSSSPSVALVPVVGAGQAGAVLTGAF